MSRLHDIFIQATKAEFYKDFSQPEARAKAAETIGKAERIYNQAAFFFSMAVDKSYSSPLLSLEMHKTGAPERWRQDRVIKAHRTYERRQARIEKVMDRQLERIRQESRDLRVQRQLGGVTFSQAANRSFSHAR